VRSGSGDCGRVVGKPYLTGLRKGCRSSGFAGISNFQLDGNAVYRDLAASLPSRRLPVRTASTTLSMEFVTSEGVSICMSWTLFGSSRSKLLVDIICCPHRHGCILRCTFPLRGAGLIMRSLFALEDVNLGFNPSKVVYADISWPDGPYDTARQKHSVFRKLLDRISQFPGVLAATAIRKPMPSVPGDEYRSTLLKSVRYIV
jgi:hypothetical protein